MCNLYRLRAAKAEIASIFDTEVPQGANCAEEGLPNYAGLVILRDGARVMNWGFPRIMTGKKGQKLKPRPVNNARTENLGSPFWRASFKDRRCLIPLTQWSEPEGEDGRMTRSWYSLPGAAPFAVAGLWQSTDLWGHCYTMVMVPACEQMAQVHDRMPVILRPEQWRPWMESAPEDAFRMLRSWDEELIYQPSDEPWYQKPLGAGRSSPANRKGPDDRQPLLL